MEYMCKEFVYVMGSKKRNAEFYQKKMASSLSARSLSILFIRIIIQLIEYFVN